MSDTCKLPRGVSSNTFGHIFAQLCYAGFQIVFDIARWTTGAQLYNQIGKEVPDAHILFREQIAQINGKQFEFEMLFVRVSGRSKECVRKARVPISRTGYFIHPKITLNTERIKDWDHDKKLVDRAHIEAVYLRRAVLDYSNFSALNLRNIIDQGCRTWEATHVYLRFQRTKGIQATEKLSFVEKTATKSKWFKYTYSPEVDPIKSTLPTWYGNSCSFDAIAVLLWRYDFDSKRALLRLGEQEELAMKRAVRVGPDQKILSCKYNEHKDKRPSASASASSSSSSATHAAAAASGNDAIKVRYVTVPGNVVSLFDRIVYPNAVTAYRPDRELNNGIYMYDANAYRNALISIAQKYDGNRTRGQVATAEFTDVAELLDAFGRMLTNLSVTAIDVLEEREMKKLRYVQTPVVVFTTNSFLYHNLDETLKTYRKVQTSGGTVYEFKGYITGDGRHFVTHVYDENEDKMWTIDPLQRENSVQKHKPKRKVPMVALAYKKKVAVPDGPGASSASAVAVDGADSIDLTDDVGDSDLHTFQDLVNTLTKSKAREQRKY